MNKEVFNKLFEFAKSKNDLLKNDENNKSLNIKGKHVEGVVDIVKKIYPNNKFLELCAYLHDIGRGLQFEKIKSFNDAKISHNILGVEVFNKFLVQNDIKNNEEIDIIRNVILYHGRLPFIKEKLDEKTFEIVHIITICDDIQNGCIDAISYLEMEYKYDLKDYIKNNPLLDQKNISPEVIDSFKKGVNFDKVKHCTTYAEYFVYACSRAVNACKSEHSNIAKSIMKLENCNYKNTIIAYEELFKKYVQEEYVEDCIKTLNEFCV